MSFSYRDPPLPLEICKRRGITLAPIITKCFDETVNSEDPLAISHIYLPPSPSVCEDEDFIEQIGGYQGVSRWSRTTQDTASQYSETDGETELRDEESYDEILERYRRYFDNRSLMKCLDTDDEELLADLLFERLLREVQELPALLLEGSTQKSRGELQVRAFWDNIRMQLQIDESPLNFEWPEGYPEFGNRLEAEVTVAVAAVLS